MTTRDASLAPLKLKAEWNVLSRGAAGETGTAANQNHFVLCVWFNKPMKCVLSFFLDVCSGSSLYSVW